MKPSPRACPYCKSPARGNPCWYYTDIEEAVRSGGDPPCTDTDYAERFEAKRRRVRIKSIIFLGIIAAVLALIVWAW